MNGEEIRKLAALARIKIEEDEIPAIAENLARIVGYVAEIQKADIGAGGASPEAGELRNVMREDGEPHPAGAYSEAILANAPEREGDYIKVKKIL